MAAVFSIAYCEGVAGMTLSFSITCLWMTDSSVLILQERNRRSQLSSSQGQTANLETLSCTRGERLVNTDTVALIHFQHPVQSLYSDKHMLDLGVQTFCGSLVLNLSSKSA